MESRSGIAEVLLLTGVVLLAGAVVWSGAALAAQFAGNSLDASFAAAMTAAPALPGALVHPQPGQAPCGSGEPSWTGLSTGRPPQPWA